MVMDRCKRRRNRLKSALGRRRVSQSEDLLRCRFSLSRTVPSSLSRTVPSRTVPRTVLSRIPRYVHVEVDPKGSGDRKPSARPLHEGCANPACM